MSNPAWQGKTVVIVWEHKHIANTKLERAFPGEQLTLRQLLGLDKRTGRRAGHPATTIISGSSITLKAQPRRPEQDFAGTHASLPSNDWGAPNGLTAKSQCDLKGAE